MAYPKSPIKYFGSKSRIASKIWKRLGDVDKYIDPFGGSMSIILSRPHRLTLRQNEIYNDFDGSLVNFWRVLKAKPRELALESRNIMRSSVEAWARASTIQNGMTDLVSKLAASEKYYDIELALNYVYLNSVQFVLGFLGGTYGTKDGIFTKLYKRRDNRGVNKSLIATNKSTYYCMDTREHIAYYGYLSKRLTNLAILCGDWKTAVGGDAMLAGLHGTEKWKTGIVFDPPYEGDNHNMDMYTSYEKGISADSRNRAIELGKDKRFRIALCGYIEEHDKHIPSDWERLAWKTTNGFSGLRKNGENNNRKRETIWFSPGCLKIQKGQVT